MYIESDVVFQRIRAWLLRKAPPTSFKRISSLNAAIASDIGLSRAQNQDRVAIAHGLDFHGTKFILVALSDGMGGMIDGERCAATTIAAFFSTFFRKSASFGMPADWLEIAVHEANRAVYNLYEGRGGATLSALLIRSDQKTYWANIGDSRIYVQNENTILQITKDDTIAGQIPGASPTLAAHNELLQYIGIGKELEAHTGKVDLKKGSYITITSDGVHYLGSDLIQRLVSVASEPGAASKRLIEVAKYVSGHDNGSAAVIEFGALENITEDYSSGTYEIWDPSSEMVIATNFSDPVIAREPSKEMPVKPISEKERKLVSDGARRITRSKALVKKSPAKKTQKEKDLLGDEIKPKRLSNKDNESKLRITFNTKDE